MMEDQSVYHCENVLNINQCNINNDKTSTNSSNSNSNLGGPTVFSTCRKWMISGKFEDVLPKESLTMSLMDWEDLYRRERLAQVHHSVYTTSGCFLQLDQRQLVMSWISDVAHRLAWEKSTFHIATSLIDQYMYCLEKDPVSRRKLDRSSLAATFAAAVVTAASLGECLGECHDRKHCPGLPPLHRFVQSSGIIRSSRDIVEMQIQLLVQTSKYNGPSLLNKTPAHMTLHYISRLKHLVDSLHNSVNNSVIDSSWPFVSQNNENFSINEEQDSNSKNDSNSVCCKRGVCWANKIGISTIVGQAVLGIREKIDYACLFEKIMFAHELALYSGINLLVPGSRISACILINILITYDPILQFPSHQNILYNSLCLLDFDTGIRPFMPYLDPLVRRVVSMSNESIHALESSSSNVKMTNNKANISTILSNEFSSGVILIHKHHIIPEKLLSGLRISTLIAMHSRLNQPNIIHPFSISSPNSIPVSPHSAFSSANCSPSSFHCSPIFYSFNNSRCYIDDKSIVESLARNRIINGNIVYKGQLQCLEDNTSNEQIKTQGSKTLCSSSELGKEDVSQRYVRKQNNNQIFDHHLHLLNNRGNDEQHLYTTCSTATNSPLIGGGPT